MSVNPLRYDPSRTGDIVRAASTNVDQVFNALSRRLLAEVGEEDTFGLGPVANRKHEFGSTHFVVTDPVVLAEHDRLQRSLDPLDVLKLEDKPHVTIRYGLHDLPDLVERVNALLAGAGPVTVRVGRLSLFRPPGKGDVLKYEVEGPELERMNARLGIVPNTATFSEYKPHMTVAYLKEGTGQKYLDRYQATAGMSMTFKHLEVSTPDEDLEQVVLNVFCPTGPGGGVDPTCSPGREIVRSVLTRLAAKYGVPEQEITVGFHSGEGVRGLSTRGTRTIADKAEADAAKAKGLKAHPVDRTGKQFMVMGPGAHVSFHGDIHERKPNPDSFKGKFHPTEATAVHEFGHVLQYRAGIDVAEASRKLTPAEKEVARTVSRYAATDYGELLSELFVKYESDGVRHPYLDRILPPEVTNAAWAPGAPREQVKAFRDYLRTLSRDVITSQGQEALWDQFTSKAYVRGAARSVKETEAKKAAPAPTKNPKVNAAIGAAQLAGKVQGVVNRDKLAVATGRTFDEVKGLSQRLQTKLSRVLNDAIARGYAPRTVARMLVKEVGIERKRAMMIARTELIRAHADGQLDALDALGETTVMANVEFLPSVGACPKCARLRGKVFTVKSARGVLPVHPNCKCCWSPAVGRKATGRRSRVPHVANRPAPAPQPQRTK